MTQPNTTPQKPDMPNVERIMAHPVFKQMEAKKSRLGLIFTVLTLLMYFSYIIAIGTNPTFFGTPVAPGRVTTWGIYWGLFVIFFSIIITAIYVYKANGEFDDLTKKMLAELDAETRTNV